MFQDEPSWPPESPPSAPVAPLGAERLWRLSDLLIGVALLILGFLVVIGAGVGIIAAIGLRRGDPTTALIFTVGTLLVEIWIGLLVLALAKRRGITAYDLGFRAPRDWTSLPLAIVGAYACLLLYGVVVLIAEQVSGSDLSFIREGNQLPDDLPRTPLIWTLLGISVVIAAPLAEELFFRGLLYRGVTGLAGPTVGIVVSGLAFSAVHANLSVVLPFALIGMIFARVYRSSGSLWTPIAAHAIFNGVSFALTVSGVGP